MNQRSWIDVLHAPPLHKLNTRRSGAVCSPSAEAQTHSFHISWYKNLQIIKSAQNESKIHRWIRVESKFDTFMVNCLFWSKLCDVTLTPPRPGAPGGPGGPGKPGCPGIPSLPGRPGAPCSRKGTRRRQFTIVKTFHSKFVFHFVLHKHLQ